MRRGLRGIAVLAVIAAHGACTGLEGLSGGGDDATPPIDERPDADACAGDACAAAPKNVVYVAADGADTNPGTEKAAPKRTIGAAIAFVETLGAKDYEIHVCRGRYDETVMLDFQVDLVGGYECSTWQRSVDGNEVVVTAAAGEAALVVDGVTGVTVSGLTLRAGDAGALRSRAVEIREGASAVLSDARLVAAGGTSKLSPTSAALLVDGGSADVRGCRIEGGSGVLDGGGYGSAGIFLEKKATSALVVSESTIDGGSGAVSSGTGSIGILALGGRVSRVENTSLRGGSGKTSVGSASIGAVLSTDGDLDFLGNVVDGGSGSCTGNCGVTGVSLSPKGRLRAQNNRVYGGEVSTPGNDARFTGIVVDTGDADVQNNEVFTGNTKKAITSAATALEIRGSTTAIVGQNTLAIGPNLLGTGTALAVTSDQGVVVNNLLVAAGGSGDPAVRVNACTTSKLTSFRNNVWAGFTGGKPLLAVDAPSGTPALCTQGAETATTAGAAESTLASRFAGIAVAGNAESAATASDLFAGWSAATAGDLLASGWKLAPTAPCAIAKATGDVGGLLPTDAFGGPRTDPRSIGAHESDGPCQ